MKNAMYLSFLFVFATMASLFANPDPGELTQGFVSGDPGIKSMNALAFGPQGILFIGDSQRAEVIAVDTKDKKPAALPEGINMEKVDVHIAAMLGTTADRITIADMAVNPASKAVYFAVHMQDGQPVLLRTHGQSFEMISLNEVSYSKIGLENAVAEDAVDRRERPLRRWAISDLAYHDGQVMVSGLSNEEFSSTFRSMPFPFEGDQMYASLEIYHAAHGRYETYAPIKTFMPYKLNGKPHLVASYTCTPLVIFPINEMQPGKHTKGKTVAELGNRNTPLDIISYEKEGKPYILLANSSRALMKIDPARIESFNSYLTEPVEENSATAGVEFIALPYVNVQQMEKLSDTQVVLLQRMSNGDLNLHTPDNRRL